MGREKTDQKKKDSSVSVSRGKRKHERKEVDGEIEKTLPGILQLFEKKKKAGLSGARKKESTPKRTLTGGVSGEKKKKVLGAKEPQTAPLPVALPDGQGTNRQRDLKIDWGVRTSPKIGPKRKHSRQQSLSEPNRGEKKDHHEGK